MAAKGEGACLIKTEKMPLTVLEAVHEMSTEVAAAVNLDACTVEIPRTAVFHVRNAGAAFS